MAVVPKVLILGDETVQIAIPKVRMEKILGEQSRFALCTKLSLLTDELCKVPSSTSIGVVVVSCLSSILDMIVNSSDVKAGIERAMLMVGNLFHDIHRMNVRVRVFVGPFLPRNTIDWTIHSRYAMRCLVSAIDNLPTVTVLNWQQDYQLRPDGSNLNEAGCKKYLEDLLTVVNANLLKKVRTTSSSSAASVGSTSGKGAGTKKDVVDLTIDEDMRKLLAEDDDDGDSMASQFSGTVTMGPENPVILTLRKKLSFLTELVKRNDKRMEAAEKQIAKTDDRLDTLETDVAKDRIQDIYTFADQCERMDFSSNLLKAGSVLITGLKALNFPGDIAGQNARTAELVKELIVKVLGREEEFSVTVRRGSARRYAKESPMVVIPPVEVKMTTSLATEFRAKGSALAKARTDGYAGLYFGQCSTLSTRVRIEILRAICKVLNEKSSENDAFCVTNTARPLLSFGPKGARGNRRTFLYVEALKKFEEEAKRADLAEAYKKARPMYNGRLERTFVLLRDDDSREEPLSGVNKEPIGKRPSDSAFESSPKRKA